MVEFDRMAGPLQDNQITPNFLKCFMGTVRPLLFWMIQHSFEKYLVEEIENR